MTSSYRSSRPPWRSPSQSYPSTAERPSPGANSASRFLSGSSYRALTGNSALPSARTYGDSGSVTALKDKFSTMARDKAVLADKRMRIAASGFGNKASSKPGGTTGGRYGSSPTGKSPAAKDQHAVTVFGVCNVPEIRTDTPADVLVTVVTRGTSPTPPAHSTFLRSKHAGQQEVTTSMVPRTFERGVHVNLQTDEKFLRNMPTVRNSSIPVVARYKGNRSGYNNGGSPSKDSGSTGENSGRDRDSQFSDSSDQGKSRSSRADSSKLPQPNGTRQRSRDELSVSRSPSVSSTAEEKPPSGRKAEEPKLVTIRSIAPVSGVAVISETPRPQYPIKKNVDSPDQTWWLQDSSNKESVNSRQQYASSVDNGSYNKEHNSSDSSYSSKIPTYNIRKMDSSDRHQWLKEATEPAVDHDESLSYPESTSCSESLKSNSNSSKNHSYALRKMDSSDRNQWLLDAVQQHDSSLSHSDSLSNADLANNSYYSNNSSRSPTNGFRRVDNADDKQWLTEVERQEAILQSSLLYGDSVVKSDSNSLSVKSPAYKVRKMDSFEAPWWLHDEQNAGDESKPSSNKTETSRADPARSPDVTTVSYGVRKMDSFDSPWWLSADEGQRLHSASDNSINRPDAVNSHDDRWSLNNGFGGSPSETGHPEQNGNVYSDETDNYLDVRHLYSSYGDEPTADLAEPPQWWAENYQNTDTSTDRSRDGPGQRDPTTGSPLAPIARGVRKMDSYESPSWLASEESESQSHEPKYTSTADGLSSSSKRNNESVDSSPDWWGEQNDSDDFVRVKRTSIRIKKIESVESVKEEEPARDRPASAAKEPNLQDELDQLMLFIGGCRNIDEILGNEEPPPAAPTTPPDSDSDDCVEIGVDQVHIHDSRAQTSTIQNKLCMVSA